MKQFISALMLLAALTFQVQWATSQTIEHIEPPNWWVDMENPELQLMIHGNNIGKAKLSLNKKGVIIKETITTDNPNYLFVDLLIYASAKPGKIKLKFELDGENFSANYELLERRKNATQKPAMKGNDAIYLITPDRFANANPENDAVNGYNEQPNRTNKDGRHGGDLQGVIQHLEYIQNLGMTALWLNPVDENNQDAFTYHGYAISDFYKTDPRYGTNEDYKRLAEELHKRGMKLVKDQVFNHCGSAHWWMDDMPANNWVNSQDYGRSVFQNQVMSDPHASNYEKSKQYRGYFDTNMPDLNYENELLSRYMIQNSIWWIEYANIDALRIDTYPYPDKDFMAMWKQELNIEYPGIFVVAEIWIQDVAYAAYWNPACTFGDNYQPHISSVTDFPLYYGMLKAFRKDGNIWDAYHVLAKDFLYGHPEQNVVFFDNHDVARSFAELGYDMNQFKLGVTFILTTRGILQWYYGSEIVMEERDNHGVIRQDMPGGWAGDTSNVFTRKNLSATQTEALNFMTRMLNWRKDSKAIASGKLIHFLPENNCYVYFRVSDDETLMVVLNNSDAKTHLNLDKYQEILNDFTKATNIIDGKEYKLDSRMSLSAKTPYVFIVD